MSNLIIKTYHFEECSPYLNSIISWNTFLDNSIQARVIFFVFETLLTNGIQGWEVSEIKGGFDFEFAIPTSRQTIFLCKG